MRDHPGYERFPEGFFDRVDETPDGVFYDQPRLVTHIDDRAIGAVGDLYAELGIGRSASEPVQEDGTVVDLMSSWISHFHEAPSSLGHHSSLTPHARRVRARASRAPPR